MKRPLGVWALLALVLTMASALVFFFGTDAYYGTFESTLWDALHPQRPEQFDNVFPCSSLNGEGSDDAVFTFLLFVLLLPSLVARLVRVRSEPVGWEAVLFALMSSPALLMHFGFNTCADIPLTLIVGHNLALAALITGWVVTLALLAVSAARRTA